MYTNMLLYNYKIKKGRYQKGIARVKRYDET